MNSSKNQRVVAEIGERIIMIRDEHENVGDLRPIVVAVYEDCVYACYGKDGSFKVKHTDYIVDASFHSTRLLAMKLEKWREEEKELLYDLQEEVANENPGKDAQRYWEAKHAYDKQKIKIEAIEAALSMAYEQ